MNCTAYQNSLAVDWMPRRKTYSFRPDADLETRLLGALDATGSQAQDIIEACVQQSLDAVARRIIENRRKAQAAYLQESPPPYHAGKRKAG